MYNTVKPKFSEAVKVLLVLSLIIVVFYQSLVIDDLTNRMNRIESEEKDLNDLTDEVQSLVENIDGVLVEHDKNIGHLYIHLEDLDDYLKRQDDRIDALEDENTELSEIINNLNIRLLNTTIDNNLTLTLPIVEPRKTPFRIGDTIAWNIESEYPLEGAIITTWFPNGTIAWKTDALTDWFFRDRLWTTAYYSQVSNSKPMLFLEPYPLGNYTYSFTYKDIFEIYGNFEVLDS